ncbi:hypothetical protein IWQ47_001394 [Aquimarina sp. EL_43]|uniref:hypothetical protein n=1 Tax=unclassified Aquimarina TaxID=2627091 RepID=UPI0018C94454|nr:MULTISPECIES: hypothetical protein [unclassified Aquimarina]MBG6130523.1 hypothetical protein [Aquimarina sp. EL_35]MBG6149303.1 hypothetical protein [Aquimarina sp. EL_32]MBG6168323.1 hypothetical protein [Aquimarina sp. EL_43]
MKKVLSSLVILCITMCLHAQHNYDNQNTIYSLSGNVGVGVTNPAAKLHINGDIRGNLAGGALRINGTYGYIDVGPLNSGWAHIYTDMPKFIFNKDVYTITNAFSSYNNDLILKTKGTERLRIKDENGYMGIGISNPQTRLHINGSIRGNLAGGALRVNGTYGYIDIGPLNSSWAHIYTDMPKFIFNKDVYTTTNAFSSYNNDLILKTKGVERLRIIDTDGTVGIGTTNTRGYKLAVNGNIRAKEVVVEASPWPDYVFRSDYKLPSLNEVKKHIKTQGHLPNIPSEKEVLENGIQIGSMHAKLLEKIEELMLYTIQQDEELKTLRKTISTLQNKVENLSK